MAVRKINDLPEGQVSKIVGIDADDNVKLMPVEMLSPSVGKYIDITNSITYPPDCPNIGMISEELWNELMSNGHGILHILYGQSPNVYVYSKIVLNEMFMGTEDTYTIADKQISIHPDYTSEIMEAKCMFVQNGTDRQIVATYRNDTYSLSMNLYWVFFEIIDNVDVVSNVLPGNN